MGSSHEMLVRAISAPHNLQASLLPWSAITMTEFLVWFASIQAMERPPFCFKSKTFWPGHLCDCSFKYQVNTSLISCSSSILFRSTGFYKEVEIYPGRVPCCCYMLPGHFPLWWSSQGFFLSMENVHGVLHHCWTQVLWSHTLSIKSHRQGRC